MIRVLLLGYFSYSPYLRLNDTKQQKNGIIRENKDKDINILMSDNKQQTKKPFEKLTITDNYMFQAVMRNTKYVKPLLEMVIGKKIRKIEVIQ